MSVTIRYRVSKAESRYGTEATLGPAYTEQFFFAACRLSQVL